MALAARVEPFDVPDIDERLERSQHVEDLGWTAIAAVADRDDDLLETVRRTVGSSSGR